MRIEQQPAYVLHATPYRETSLLLECLTRDHGRVGIVARGVRGEKAKLKRAQLEPFQLVAMDLLLRGELATLTAVEPVGTPRRFVGDTSMAGLYLNELVVRLTERQDPFPALFDAYAVTLARLGGDAPLAWTLRRFERDLLEAIGYGLQLSHDSETGEPIDAQGHYRYQVDQGAIRSTAGHARAILGADLLALHQDEMPDNDGLRTLRGLMREVIRYHLGGAELRAWRVLAMAGKRR